MLSLLLRCACKSNALLCSQCRVACRRVLTTVSRWSRQVPDEEVSLGEVEALVTEADAYSLASHLLWAMWALLQSKVRLHFAWYPTSAGGPFPPPKLTSACSPLPPLTLHGSVCRSFVPRFVFSP